MDNYKRQWIEKRRGGTRAGFIQRPKVVETVEESERSDSETSETGTESQSCGKESDTSSSSIEVLSKEEAQPRGEKDMICELKKRRRQKYFKKLIQRYERRGRIARMRIDVLQREMRLLKKLIDKDRLRKLKGKTNLLIHVKEEQRTVEQLGR